MHFHEEIRFFSKIIRPRVFTFCGFRRKRWRIHVMSDELQLTTPPGRHPVSSGDLLVDCHGF